MNNNDEIRKAHALMELDSEIAWCNMVLNSGASDADKESARQRLKSAQAKKKEIESARNEPFMTRSGKFYTLSLEYNGKVLHVKETAKEEIKALDEELLAMGENKDEVRVNEINARKEEIKAKTKILFNYDLNYLLINCNKQDIGGLIYYLFLETKRENINGNNIKDRIFNKISNLLPEDIAVILPESNPIKRKYYEKNLLLFRSHAAVPADDAGCYQSAHDRRLHDGGVRREYDGQARLGYVPRFVLRPGVCDSQ